MIWFFERECDRLYYEIRRQSDGSEYELVITYPDGTELVERFTDASQLMTRSGRLRSELFDLGWRTLGQSTKRSHNPGVD
jgi:hypothetical protein